MKKERSINELLKLMLDHEEYFYSGLCAWVTNLIFHDIVSLDEGWRLRVYIRKNRPKNKYHKTNHTYFWEIHNKSPRIKWLQKHIKLTNKQ